MNISTHQLRRIIRKALVEAGDPNLPRADQPIEMVDEVEFGDWAEVPVQIRNIQMELEDILTLSAEPGSLEEEVQDFIGDAVVNLSRTLSTLKVMWPRK